MMDERDVVENRARINLLEATASTFEKCLWDVEDRLAILASRLAELENSHMMLDGSREESTNQALEQLEELKDDICAHVIFLEDLTSTNEIRCVDCDKVLFEACDKDEFDEVPERTLHPYHCLTYEKFGNCDHTGCFPTPTPVTLTSALRF